MKESKKIIKVLYLKLGGVLEGSVEQACRNGLSRPQTDLDLGSIDPSAPSSYPRYYLQDGIKIINLLHVLVETFDFKIALQSPDSLERQQTLIQNYINALSRKNLQLFPIHIIPFFHKKEISDQSKDQFITSIQSLCKGSKPIFIKLENGNKDELRQQVETYLFSKGFSVERGKSYLYDTGISTIFEAKKEYRCWLIKRIGLAEALEYTLVSEYWQLSRTPFSELPSRFRDRIITYKKNEKEIITGQKYWDELKSEQKRIAVNAYFQDFKPSEALMVKYNDYQSMEQAGEKLTTLGFKDLPPNFQSFLFEQKRGGASVYWDSLDQKTHNRWGQVQDYFAAPPPDSNLKEQLGAFKNLREKIAHDSKIKSVPKQSPFCPEGNQFFIFTKTIPPLAMSTFNIEINQLTTFETIRETLAIKISPPDKPIDHNCIQLIWAGTTLGKEGRVQDFQLGEGSILFFNVSKRLTQSDIDEINKFLVSKLDVVPSVSLPIEYKGDVRKPPIADLIGQSITSSPAAQRDPVSPPESVVVSPAGYSDDEYGSSCRIS